MVLAPKLSLRQTTSLVMTPQLQQAIKLLQLSSLDLKAYVEQELEQNPMLDKDDGDDDAAVPSDTPIPESSVDRIDDGGEGWDEVGGAPDVPDTMDLSSTESMPVNGETPLDTDYENVWTDDAPASEPSTTGEAFADWGGGGGFDDTDFSLEQTLCQQPSLQDHLLDQLNIDICDPVDRMIGIHLIDMVDEAGRLSGDLADVTALLNCDLERVEAALAKLQTFDPPGVFARSLAECLALQLRELNRLDPIMQKLLDNLDLYSKRDFAGLKKLCDVDGDELAEMIEEIKDLNPKPGLVFDHNVVEHVIPDVIIRPDSKGGWHVELNPEALPKVLVNQQYHARVSGEVRTKEDKEYISECFQNATWLVKSLAQRATTILKVASEIVRRQDGFLVHGVQHLRPLILRDIAEAIEMHESTISRVTNNKFMVTPRGTYELRYFFTTAISNSEGGLAHSAEAVRFRIKELIDNEKSDAILSDDKIVDILCNEGIDIARRTIAKYREAMHIASSVRRRREKTISF